MRSDRFGKYLYAGLAMGMGRAAGAFGTRAGGKRSTQVQMRVEQDLLKAGVKPGQKPNPASSRLNSNPSRSGRKITMPIQKFAEWLKRKRDPKLWKAFCQKIEAYRKWTHGSLPKTVTVESLDVPGVTGLWITHDMGKQPESLYVMPKNSKRKGAWRHPWGRMPSMKGDPQAGVMLTKLASGNRMTDFLHG